MKQSTFSIPKPCHESWEDMKAQGHGRHCGQCDKVVYDMTSKSHEEVKRHFEDNNGQLCGRFRPSQIVHFPLGRQSLGKRLLRRFALSILIVFGSTLFSWGASSGNVFFTQLQDAAGLMQSPDTTEMITIRGSLKIQETGEPMMFANVVLRDGGLVLAGAVSDFDGNFSFQIAKAELEAVNEPMLYASFVGYEEAEEPINKNNPEAPLQIMMRELDINILGGAMMGVFMELDLDEVTKLDVPKEGMDPDAARTEEVDF